MTDTKLKEFLLKLSEDPRLLAKYKKDPQGVMKAEGLSDNQIAVIMKGDISQIRSLIADKDSTIIIIVVVVVVA